MTTLKYEEDLIAELQRPRRIFPEASFVLDEEYLRAAVAKIFFSLQEKTGLGPGNTVCWPETLESPEESNARAFTSPYLYNGTSGIALFLSAYYKFSGCLEARDLAVRAMAPIRAKLNSWKNAGDNATRTAIPIGGLNGLGAFVYTFRWMAEWLDIPEYLESARLAAAAITAQRIHGDESLDVMSGCAGALLALLALEPVLSPEERQSINSLALACGQHLLARRTAGGTRAWTRGARAPLTGFAHGASGIAYALIKLFAHSRQNEFLDAACEAFDCERSLYDPIQKTWLDPRFERPLEQAAWCNGAPGIALSRLAALRAAPVSSFLDDLELALRLTAELPISPRDHLCCGNFGWIEIMCTAGRQLNRPDLIQQARNVAAICLRKADASSFSFPFSDQRPGELRECRFQPSLFLGLAGVGYTTLRLLQPEVFPCVLLMD